jgi:hypothetical protein
VLSAASCLPHYITTRASHARESDEHALWLRQQGWTSAADSAEVFSFCAESDDAWQCARVMSRYIFELRFLCAQVAAVVVGGSRAAGRRDHGHASGDGISGATVRGAAAAESVEELLGLSAFKNV